MVKYWERLSSLMGDKSIGALAKDLGISFQAVAKVRDGGSFGSDNNIKAAKLFGVNPEWLATGKGPKLVGDGRPGAVHGVSDAAGTYTVITLESAVARIAQHLESVDTYNTATAISLFSTLANDPGMHEIVAAGLKTLKPEARTTTKQSAPAQETGRHKAA